MYGRVGQADYPHATKIAQDFVRAAPDRLVWGSDWPHPGMPDEKPDDALLFDLLSVIRRLAGVGASLRSLTEPIDTSTALGELVLQILGAIAQFELSLIRERVRAGKSAAVERGVVFGRRRQFDYSRLVELRQSGLAWADVADVVGGSSGSVRSAFYRLRDGHTGIPDPRAAS